MKQILQIIILFTSLTCFSQSQSDNIDLVGTWKYYFGYFEYKLTLYQDSTYSYRMVGDLNKRQSEGNWKLVKNKLILNSFKQKASETRIISNYIDSINGVKFFIKTEKGEPVCFPHIRIKNNLTEIDTLVENQCEIFEFENFKNIQEFKISFIGLKDAIWVGKMNPNYFEVIMVPERDDYIYQTNEIWKIKGDRLYSPSSKKDNKYFRNKDRINYFLIE